MNRVRWARAIWSGVTISAVVFGIALLPIAWRAYREYAETRISPVVATSELNGLLTAILSQVPLDGGSVPPPPPPPLPGGELEPPLELKSKPLLLVNSTVTVCEKGATDPSCTHLIDTDFWPDGFSPKIPLQMRRELVAASGSSVAFECPNSEKVICGSAASAASNSGHFPGVAGTMRVSNAVLSHDHAEALLYVEFECGKMCASGKLVLFRRNGSGWAVAQQERLWDV